MRFRRNIERIGEIMAYEMSKELHYKEINIQTHWVLRKQLKFQLVISSVLRAGLPSYGFSIILTSRKRLCVGRYHNNR
jgi:uracil phosphoribosyltransferase